MVKSKSAQLSSDALLCKPSLTAVDNHCGLTRRKYSAKSILKQETKYTSIIRSALYELPVLVERSFVTRHLTPVGEIGLRVHNFFERSYVVMEIIEVLLPFYGVIWIDNC
jgi:hypothetical protein